MPQPLLSIDVLQLATGVVLTGHSTPLRPRGLSCQLLVIVINGDGAGHKFLGICRVPPPFGQKVRRIDIFSCPPDQCERHLPLH